MEGRLFVHLSGRTKSQDKSHNSAFSVPDVDAISHIVQGPIELEPAQKKPPPMTEQTVRSSGGRGQLNAEKTNQQRVSFVPKNKKRIGCCPGVA